MAGYTNVHRLYLQSLISRRYLSERLAKKLYKRACDIVAAAEGNDAHPPQFQDVIEDIGNALSPLGLEIRALIDEGTRERMYAIVNTKGDAIAQVATEFSPLEIAYFKLIVECIMLAPSESFSLSAIAAIKESGNLTPKMTKTDAEANLNAFVSKGWLVKSKRGRYSLSTRSILELQTYLKTTFEDEGLECTICMEICTKGIACPVARCKTRLHAHCNENYRIKHHECPSCNADWRVKRPLPVGEDAVKDGADSRRRARREETEESPEEEAEEQPTQEDGDEDEDMDETPPAAKRRTSRQKKASQMSIAGGYSVDDDDDD